MYIHGWAMYDGWEMFWHALNTKLNYIKFTQCIEQIHSNIHIYHSIDSADFCSLWRLRDRSLEWHGCAAFMARLNNSSRCWMPMETKKFTTLPGCPGYPGTLLTSDKTWQNMTKHDKTMSLDAASYWSILKYIELVVASFQFSWIFFHEFVDTCSAWIEMAAFSLTFCTFPAKDFLAATVNVRGRWRPLGRKMSSLGTRINSQVGQWSKELSWNYKDKEFYLSYFIVLWLRMWFNYYFNAVYCSQGQGK